MQLLDNQHIKRNALKKGVFGVVKVAHFTTICAILYRELGTFKDECFKRTVLSLSPALKQQVASLDLKQKLKQFDLTH